MVDDHFQSMLFFTSLLVCCLFATTSISAHPQSFAQPLTQIASATGTFDKNVDRAKFAYNVYKVLKDQADNAGKQISKVHGSSGAATNNA